MQLPPQRGDLAEGRPLPYQMQILDNVKVGSARLQLFVDKNSDGERFQLTKRWLSLADRGALVWQLAG